MQGPPKHTAVPSIRPATVRAGEDAKSTSITTHTRSYYSYTSNIPQHDMCSNLRAFVALLRTMGNHWKRVQPAAANI